MTALLRILQDGRTTQLTRVIICLLKCIIFDEFCMFCKENNKFISFEFIDERLSIEKLFLILLVVLLKLFELCAM